MLQGHEKLMLKGEVEGLRHLIRSLRATYEADVCKCESMAEGRVCNRCFYMGTIDRGLAQTAKERDNG